MTEKEKAEELVDLMYYVDDEMRGFIMSKDTARKCALIATNEKYVGIINVLVDLEGRGSIDDKTYLKALDDMNAEWDQVRSEIEKL
jgi:hypothetical protein